MSQVNDSLGPQRAAPKSVAAINAEVKQAAAAIQSLPSPAPAAPGSGEQFQGRYVFCGCGDPIEQASEIADRMCCRCAADKDIQAPEWNGSDKDILEFIVAKGSPEIAWAFTDRIATLTAEVERLKEYCRHKPSCQAFKAIGRRECTCGFEQLEAEYAAHIAKGKP